MDNLKLTIYLSEDDVKRLYQMGDHYSSLRARVADALELGLKIACNEERGAVESSLSEMRKYRLIELLMECYDQGKVSLCTLEMPSPPPSIPSDDVKHISALLAAYKRKIDELLPTGEIFVPDIDLRSS